MSRFYKWKLGQPPPILGEHSVAKHDIFEQNVGIYIERLTRTVSQTFLNLTIVDGFSGGGLYRRDSVELDGSPLRLLTAVEAADRLRPTLSAHDRMAFNPFSADLVAHMVNALRKVGLPE